MFSSRKKQQNQHSTHACNKIIVSAAVTVSQVSAVRTTKLMVPHFIVAADALNFSCYKMKIRSRKYAPFIFGPQWLSGLYGDMEEHPT